MLILAPLQVDELLGGSFQPGDLDIRETLPFGIVDGDVCDSLCGIPGHEGPAEIDPPSTVANRGQGPVHRCGAAFFSQKLLDVIACNRPGPLVGVVAAGRLGEKLEEAIQIPGFGLDGILGVGTGLQAHVQVEPGDQAVPFRGRRGLL